MHSDLDMPPYDKAMMDGYAVRMADLSEGCGELAVIEEVNAGQTPRLALGRKTGDAHHDRRPDPDGRRRRGHGRADAVGEDGRVHIDDPPFNRP